MWLVITKRFLKILGKCQVFYRQACNLLGRFWASNTSRNTCICTETCRHRLISSAEFVSKDSSLDEKSTINNFCEPPYSPYHFSFDMTYFHIVHHVRAFSKCKPWLLALDYSYLIANPKMWSKSTSPNTMDAAHLLATIHNNNE